MNTIIESILDKIPTPKSLYPVYFKLSLTNVAISVVVSIFCFLGCIFLDSLFGGHKIAAVAMLGGVFSTIALFPSISRFRTKVLRIGKPESSDSLFLKALVFFILYAIPAGPLNDTLVTMSDEMLWIIAMLWFVIVALLFRLAFSLVQTIEARKVLSSFLVSEPFLDSVSWPTAWRLRLLIACLKGCPESVFSWAEVNQKLPAQLDRFEFLSQLNIKLFGTPIDFSMSDRMRDTALHQNSNIKMEQDVIHNCNHDIEHYSVDDLQDMVLLNLVPGFSEKDLQEAFMKQFSIQTSSPSEQTATKDIKEAYKRLQKRFIQNLASDK